jgi:predicted XRE-type DNA-binding protein
MQSGSKPKRSLKAADDDSRIEAGSGNVFADLGLPNPELLQAKAELVRRLRAIISDRQLNQSKAATLLGIPQPKLSALLSGQTQGFTIDRIFRLLNALGQRVEITLYNEPASKKRKIAVVG